MLMKTVPMKCDKSGFTLIELLVVIAIIAILAAILFPVFAQAREKARQITCVSNERQIGLGILQYEQDYDEDFPMMHYNDGDSAKCGGSGCEVRWENAVAPYIKNGQVYTYDGYYSGTGGVWTCPDEPIAQPNVYGVNYELFREGNGYWWPYISISIATIDAPSNTVMICEKGENDGNNSWLEFQTWEGNWVQYPSNGNAANGYNYSPHLDISNTENCDYKASNNAPAYNNWNGCSMMPRYRHSGGTTSNFLFCDGHVQSMVKGQINWYTNIYVARDYDAQLFCGGQAGKACQPY